MTLTDSKTNEDEIKRYLFAEMSPDERDGFDEKLFLNDELFFDVADVENRLVDAYIRSDLTGDEQARFERSLALIPSRREKVANARSLREFIDDERPAEKPVEIGSRSSVWQQLTSFISGGTPAFATAMAALMVVLVVSIGILLFRNSQKNAEIARLQSDQQRRAELETELESLRQRENELKTAIDDERETSGDISDELERERTHRIEIERELEKTKHENPPPSTSPIIASVFLSPLGGRGGAGGTVPDVKIGADTKRLSMRLALSDDVKPEDRLTVRLNQKVTAKDVAPRGAAGKFTINVTVQTQNLIKGKNSLEVLDADGRSVGTYGFTVLNK